MNESDTAYSLTISDSVDDVMARVHDYWLHMKINGQLCRYLTNGVSYVQTRHKKLTVNLFTERQPTAYFESFFETPEDIRDYSMNKISRYYTEGRQLTINMKLLK